MQQTKTITGKKSNKAFMILSALGIMGVVNAHFGQPVSLLTDVFPYDSYMMPMFTFISGYFFKESHCGSWKQITAYGWGKVRKLLLPFLGWVVFYEVLSGILFKAGIWNIPAMSLRDLIYGLVTSGITSAFNSPAWFAPLLFLLCIGYCILRRLLHRIWNDHVALVLLIALGCGGIALSRSDFNVPLHLLILKVMFFLQFLHLGFYFRKYLENSFDRCNDIPVCIASILINLALIAHYGNSIKFPICSVMGGFTSDNLLLPLITSITGIAFWLKISKALVPLLGQSKLVNYISDNTFFIMTHHIGLKHVFIALCLLAYDNGISAFSGIDKQQFLSDGLYQYDTHPWCNPLCLLFTTVLLVLSCKLCDAIQQKISRILTKKQP